MSKEYADSWLRWKREQMGFTLDEVAEKAGVTRAALNRYEHGRRRPSSEIAERLAAILDATVPELFGSQPSPGVILNRALEEWDLEDDNVGVEVVSDEVFERDMARLDSEKGRKARDDYYERQDPQTYQPWVLELPDGRVIIEKPPQWFGSKMRLQRTTNNGGARSRGKRTKSSSRRARSRSSGSDSDDPGEREPALGGFYVLSPFGGSNRRLSSQASQDG